MYIRLAGRGQQRQKLYLTLDGEKRREETARAAAEVEVEEVAVGWWKWKMEAGGVQHAKPNFISHFEKDKLNINAREKPKKEPKLEHNKGEYETYQ